jgi:malate dehydrogenase
MGSSAYYAPASAAVQMARSYLYDEKRLLPCAAFLRGEYGVHDVYMGVPAVIGGQGVEKIVVIELDATERQMLESSVQGVRELISVAASL